MHSGLLDAQAIIDAAQGGTDLTRQLMAFSRKRIEDLGPVDLGGLIEHSRRTFERLVGPSVRVEISLAPGLPAVMTDAAQFEHVLVNLVANARDAMPDGGTLTVSAAAAHDGRSVELVIGDSGSGMDEATQAHIFEPLFTTKPSGRGTGFGLATAAAVVAGSGGRISVASAPGAGASFTIRLPVAGGSPDGPEIEPV